MPKPKQGTTEQGKIFHYSAGAIIEQDGKYLLLDRKLPPPGFAGPAGHIDEGEEPEVTIIREVGEETGLIVDKSELLFSEFVEWNDCSYNVTGHYWYLYQCQTSGELKPEWDEMKSLQWYTKEQLRELNLERVWEHWFKKAGVL